MKDTLNKAAYRAALEKIKAINEVGGVAKMGQIRAEFDLPDHCAKGYIPNLNGVDLEKNFEKLYKVQLAHILEERKKASNRSLKAYRRREELEKENAALRKRIAELEGHAA